MFISWTALRSWLRAEKGAGNGRTGSGDPFGMRGRGGAEGEQVAFRTANSEEPRWATTAGRGRASRPTTTAGRAV